MMGRIRRLPLVAVAACAGLVMGVLLFVGGCGGGGDDGVETGTVRVALTDAWGPYENVVLAIREIRLVPQGRENAATGREMPLVVSFTPAVQYDVADLAFAQQLLGQAVVPAGEHNQLRLVLEPNPATGEPLNYITLTGDPLTKIPLNTPSGQTSGLKVIGHYTVEPGVVNVIALDFDPGRAIVQAGSSGIYNFKPTGIRIVELDNVLPTYASISGNVLPAAVWPTAVIQVIPQGGTEAIAAGSVNPEDGSFRAFVPAGSYALRITATGYEAYDSRLIAPPVYYDAVVGADTPVGDIVLTQ